MKKFLIYFLAGLLFYFITLVGVQATPFELVEDGSGLTPDNVWTNGEIYSLLGGSINLTAGHYDLAYSLSGTVWTNVKGHNWETNDKIIINAFLDENLIGSTIGDGLYGNNKPFEFSLSLNFDLETDGLLDIIAFSEVSAMNELWRVDMSNSSILNGTFTSYQGGNNEIVPAPEPATMLLVGSGLIGLAGYSRRKFRKK